MTNIFFSSHTGDITINANIHFIANVDIDGTMNDVDVGMRSDLVVLKDRNSSILGEKQFNR